MDIWAEVTCPWCGPGNHRAAKAIERFEHADQVELVHHSFPLSSSFPEGDTFSIREALLQAGDAPACGPDGCAVPERA